jgi:hypothetical protein
MFEKEAERVLKKTSEIIDEAGPRLTGSTAAKRCAAVLAEEASTFCDKVTTETFSVHPGAFLGFVRVMVGFYALSVPLLLVFPWVSAILMSLGVLVFVGENMLYKKTLDPFYPKVEGLNVVGVVEPEAEAERQVIVSGHHDSAHIFNFFVDKPELYARRLNGGMATFFLFWAAAFVVVAIGAFPLRLATAILFAVGFLLVLPLWRFASEEGTPGAGDNLASSLAALEMARVFSARRNSDQGLKRTRVIFVSFDAEEAGLRGARAYAKAHRGEFNALPTYAFNMDCVYTREKFRLLLTDINCTVKLDEAATRRLVQLGKERDLSITAAPIVFLTGGTDAGELAKAGVRTVSLMGMDWSNSARSSVYHTPDDRVEAIEPGAVVAAIELGVNFIEEVETGRL